MTFAELALWAAQIYAAAGFAAGVAFIAFGIGKVDPAAAGFRPLFWVVVLPGCIVLWPLVLRRWMAVRAAGA